MRHRRNPAGLKLALTPVPNLTRSLTLAPKCVSRQEFRKVNLEEMLTREAVMDYRQMKTGEKYLVTPHA